MNEKNNKIFNHTKFIIYLVIIGWIVSLINLIKFYNNKTDYNYYKGMFLQFSLALIGIICYYYSEKNLYPNSIYCKIEYNKHNNKVIIGVIYKFENKFKMIIGYSKFFTSKIKNETIYFFDSKKQCMWLIKCYFNSKHPDQYLEKK